uniref:Uncharacterized protein n=1 Tax=Globodera rostochiensis TaxID=31243 RepID=A0A914HIZ3_GLORO
MGILKILWKLIAILPFLFFFSKPIFGECLSQLPRGHLASKHRPRARPIVRFLFGIDPQQLCWPTSTFVTFRGNGGDCEDGQTTITPQGDERWAKSLQFGVIALD